MRKFFYKNIFVIITIMFITWGLTACTTSTNNEEPTESTSSEKVEYSQNEKSTEHNDEEVKEETEDKKGDAKEEEQEEFNSGGFFWKVEKNGTTVYMLGSTHYATQEYYPLHPKIESAFSDSNYLVVESDILNKDYNQEWVNKYALYQDGSSLKDHLPQELYEDLKEKLKKLGISYGRVRNYKPWYVVQVIESISMHKVGPEYSLGIEMHFLKKATDKETIELEGSEFQINIFDNFSESLQIALLEGAVKAELEDYMESEDKFKTIWDNGDLEMLEETALTLNEEKYREESEEFLNEIGTQRNIRMVEKMEEYFNGKSETYFFIVGANHYVGDTGIIHILEEKGYEVERINVHE